MFKTGLVLMAVLSVGDIAGLALTDGEHPPYVVAVLGAVLGAASLALVVQVWHGRRRSLAPLLVLRVVSALTAVPAFLLTDVPVAAVVAAAAVVGVTAVATLLLARPTQVAAVAR